MDYRAEVAGHYDLQPAPFGNRDVDFYRSLVGPGDTVLELGCGTGRVLVPLAEAGLQMHGVDLSEGMLASCRERMDAARLTAVQATVQQGDITHLNLGRRFDLIIAPFRVFQNLETDAQVGGFFETVRRHLAPDGSAVLNAFNPRRDVWDYWDRMSQEELVSWERPLPDGRLICSEFMRSYDRERFVAYPRLIYRKYRGDEMVDEAVLDIVMRAYWPDDFLALIGDHGFEIVNKWGGYDGQPYGEGPELVVQFSPA